LIGLDVDAGGKYLMVIVCQRIVVRLYQIHVNKLGDQKSTLLRDFKAVQSQLSAARTESDELLKNFAEATLTIAAKDRKFNELQEQLKALAEHNEAIKKELDGVNGEKEKMKGFEEQMKSFAELNDILKKDLDFVKKEKENLLAELDVEKRNAARHLEMAKQFERKNLVLHEQLMKRPVAETSSKSPSECCFFAMLLIEERDENLICNRKPACTHHCTRVRYDGVQCTPDVRNVRVVRVP
jgi:hypothetical protein